MKLKIYTKWISVIIAVQLLFSYLPCAVYAQSDLPDAGDIINNFEVTGITKREDTESFMVFRHQKTGALVVYNGNGDNNRSFGISFRTPMENNRGIAHILEHAVLSGSRKYPSSTLFFNLTRQTYNTSMNASTYQNFTTYPVASMSEEQLYKLADFYLDSVFNPLIYSDMSIFEREGWHYELESRNDELKMSGTVYSEMQGKQDISRDDVMNTRKVLFPGSYSSNVPGGNPSDITEAAYEEVVEYHKKYYHPSNSLTVLYGNIDYKEFLKLLDEYFSGYEKKDIKIDFNNFSAAADNEKTFYYPVYSNDEMTPYVTYAFEYKDAGIEDIANMYELADLMNSSSGELTKQISEQFPDASASCRVDIDGPEAVIAFSGTNIGGENKYKFKDIIDKVIADVISSGISDELKKNSAAETRRRVAKGFYEANAGVSLSATLAELWAMDYDFYGYINHSSETLSGKTDDFLTADMIGKYLSPSNRTALVTTLPDAGLKDKELNDMRKRTSEIKGSMSEEELDRIIADTALYRKNAAMPDNNTDKAFIDEINVLRSSDFTEEIKDYNIQDTEINGIRYVTAEADVSGMGKGRIMIDASGISGEDIYWLDIYNTLAKGAGSEKYSPAQLDELKKRYVDCDTDIITLKTPEGMKPYFIFKYEGFSDESEEIFDIAEQVLFKTDLKNTDMIKSVINYNIGMFKYNIEHNPYSFMLMRAGAASDDEYAYFNALSGIDFYEFLNRAADMINSEPDKVTENLARVRNTLYNRSGAMLVYAGSEESIKRNTEAAQKFFDNIPYKEIQPADFSYLRTKQQSEMLVIDSDMNHNGIYASFADMGTEYDGSLEVAWQYVFTKFLIPLLRNQYNVYGISGSYCDETGFWMCTYIDPGFENTIATYIALPEMIRNTEITQEEVNNYILSVYSNAAKSRGELHSAYWAAADYTTGQTPEKKAERLRRIRGTTVEDIKNYADFIDKAIQNGVLCTAGNAGTAAAYGVVFNEILNPFNYEIKDDIKIIINGQRLRTDIPARIVNDITLVPMRNIFEGLGAEVSWNGDTMTASAKKDGRTINVKIGSNIISVLNADGSQYEIETEAEAVIEDDYTLIQLRAVSEAFGCKVEWEAGTRTVYIEF